MTITNTLDGPTLTFWGGAAALDWERFKITAIECLSCIGYKTVYTSHAFKKEAQSPFKEWFGDPEKLLPIRNPNDTPAEAAVEQRNFAGRDQFVYCGHKGVIHVEIARELLTSYNNLPILLCEFDQHYSAAPGGTPANRLCVYLTGVAEYGKHSEVARTLHKTLECLPKLHPNFRHHHNDSCEDRCPASQLQFRNAANELTDAWLITAVAAFDWVEPPKPAEPPAVPTDHSK